MKRVEDMTIDECRYEIERLDDTFRDYDRIGQGISSKETVRKRALDFKVRMAEILGEETAMSIKDDLVKFMVQGAELFREREG